MAKGRKPAIQANQGHPGGIVDDVLIPIAKKVIRKTAKTHKGALAKEAKMLSNRHETLMAKRRSAAAQSLYGKTSVSRAVGKARYSSATKKSTSNLRSASRTAQDYATDPRYVGLPTSLASPKGAKKGPSRRNIKKTIITNRRKADYEYMKKNTPWHGPSDAELAKAVSKAKYNISRKQVSQARKNAKKK